MVAHLDAAKEMIFHRAAYSTLQTP